MRLFLIAAGSVLTFLLVADVATSEAADEATHARWAAELRVSSPVGNISECQSGCSIATDSSKQAAVDRVVALSEATPEDRAEMLREMQLDPPLFD
jgi:hypothetical protein